MSDALATSRRYRVLRRLAAGGMGEVLLAEFVGDEHVGSGLVVVKRTLPNSPQKEHQNTMLREEGRVAVRLVHENLVETFFVDEHGGEPLLVMEYLAGRSMAQVLGAAKKKKELAPVEVCLAVVRAAACGLHFAHTLQDRGRPLGLVHRDVSPANVFVTFDGKVKVIDFGVAKADDSEIRTSTGILKGKIGYMSPEHAVGERLGPAADMWSLGVVLWESLLAERLFLGQNPSVTLHQITHKHIDPPSTMRPELPERIDALCMRLLERDPARRVQSGAALVALIDALPEARALPRLNLGGFLSQRFPEDAAQGMQEAAHAARPRRRTPTPAGLVDGAAPVGNADPDVPTLMLEKSELLALAQKTGAGGADAAPDEDLRTLRLPYPLETTDDLARGSFGDAAPARGASGEGVATTAAQLRTEALPAPVAAQRPRTPSSSRPTPPAPEPRRGPSAVAVALTTFGLLATLMGTAFSFLSAARAPQPVLYAYRAADGYDVVVGAVEDAPPSVPVDRVRQLEQPVALLWKAGDATAQLVDAATLHPKLEEAGVLQRARQPKTRRALVSAALPAAIAFVGLLSLAVALPQLLLRGARARVLACAIAVAAAVLVGAVAWRFGALGWPGTAAMSPRDPPRLEWR